MNFQFLLHPINCPHYLHSLKLDLAVRLILVFYLCAFDILEKLHELLRQIFHIVFSFMYWEPIESKCKV